MITYKLVNDANGQLNCIARSDVWFIPINPSNTDYREYLKWVAEGNTPEPADEPS